MALRRHPTTAERSLTEYSLDAPLLTFDIPMLLAQLKHENLWRTGKRNAMTLLKDHGLRVVLIVLHAGTAIPSHPKTCHYPGPLRVSGQILMSPGLARVSRVCHARGPTLVPHQGCGGVGTKTEGERSLRVSSRDREG